MLETEIDVFPSPTTNGTYLKYDNGYSWAEQQATCEAAGMSLPTYYDLCPEGSATSQDTAPYTFAESDVWIPYSGDCNDGDTNTWVELGHSTHIFCGTHHDTGCADITSCCGGYPGWGEANGDEYAWVYVTGLPSVLCVAGYDNYGGDEALLLNRFLLSTRRPWRRRRKASDEQKKWMRGMLYTQLSSVIS